MKKLLKLVVILVVMMISFPINSLAFATAEEATTANDAYVTLAATNDTSTNTSTKVTTSSNANDNELSTPDILNILLIAIGIVIIILAGAILVKIK